MRYNIEFRKMTYYGLIISFYQKIEVNLWVNDFQCPANARPRIQP